MRLHRSYIKEGTEFFPHYYLYPYLPLAGGDDPLSESFIRFKQRRQPDLGRWLAGAAASLSGLTIDAGTIILRPLHHAETTVHIQFPTALDLLGQALAERFSCRYLPTLLSKTRPTLPTKFLTRRERRTQLQDVYRFDFAAQPAALFAAALSPIAPSSPHNSLPAAAVVPPQTPFLLIDDILTTGATMRAVIHTLRLSLPVNPIRIFTLTRAANTV